MATRDLSVEQLREALHYDPQSGSFTWKPRAVVCKSWTRKYRGGQSAGRVTCQGYLRIRILGGEYPGHRLAWLYVFGHWPSRCIDHINGNRLDNRIANLRDVSQQANTQNHRVASLTNRSGFLGVTAHKKKWRATITVDGRAKHIGVFETPHEAHAAYVEAKRSMHEGCSI